MRSLSSKAINNIYYLSSFYYCNLFPNIWNGIIIITLVVPKICCISRLNSWHNIIDPDRKRKAVMRMKVYINKGICSKFVRNVLYGCRDDHDDLPLVDQSIKLPPWKLQKMPCLRLVLLCLEFIIYLIESTCTSLILINLDTLLWNVFESISEIHVKLEAIICEEWPPIW